MLFLPLMDLTTKRGTPTLQGIISPLLGEEFYAQPEETVSLLKVCSELTDPPRFQICPKFYAFQSL